ncbi:MAG: hypothetical protein PHE68_03535 [Candidatus Peribacteraceae bacterium]|nr:hypothetical protein [Candidatus Peribacteraceae bacterium]
MLRKSSVFLFALLFCAPLLARAEESTVLNLGSAREQQEWNMRKLTELSPVQNGLHIRTSVAGTLLRPLTLSHGIDVVEITYTSPRGGPFALLWQGRDAGDSYYQLPLNLGPAAQPKQFIVALGAVGNWNNRPTALGFSFPEGTDVTIRTVTLHGWNVVEKLVENVKCFWTFDVIAPHSINFLWGPLLCSSPAARKVLYEHAPPIAHSGMRVIYAVLGLALIIIGFRTWFSGSDRNVFVRRALLVTFIFWAILDLRAGAEFLRNWTTDIRMYVSEPAGRRAFRSLEFFPDFSAVVAPILKDQPKYVLLSNFPERYIRYYTWPSQPVQPSAGSGALYWLVYDRKDLTLNPEGRITDDGVPLSPPGSIIHEFMKGTYVFRVRS